jgi:hypothetical protein
VPDSGSVVVVVDAGAPDSGINGTCPSFTASALTLDPPGNQDILIARVLFRDDGTADVVLRGSSALLEPFNFGDAPVLCSGPDTCIDTLGDLPDLAANAETTVNLDFAEIDGGEIALLSATPDTADFLTFAYIAWGDYEPANVPGGDDTLEQLAAGRWNLADRITVTGDADTIVGTGDTTVETGFTTCDGDGDF